MVTALDCHCSLADAAARMQAQLLRFLESSCDCSCHAVKAQLGNRHLEETGRCANKGRNSDVKP